MRIATLSIGDELVQGEIVDTNASYIARLLWERGMQVAEHRTVGDDELAIAEALRSLAERHDAVIATGGLGPTVDDLTTKGAALATGRGLTLNSEALAHLKEFSEKSGLPLIEGNEKQALLPARVIIIPNMVGTACGFQLSLNDSQLFFLPGVPEEMKPMLEQGVLAAVEAGRKRRRVVRTRVLKVFGLSEVQVDGLMKELQRQEAGLTVAFRVVFPEVRVKLRQEGTDPSVVERALAEAVEFARKKLKECVFGEEETTLEGEVAKLFREKGVTLSLAESCTGGQVAKMITDQAGSSRYFLEGAVTYSNEAKVRTLGVSPEMLQQKGAVSAEVASAMAIGIRGASGSDIGLSVTGIAGPDGGTEEKPVGTVFIALATRSGTVTKGYRFSGDRQRIRTITTFMAMDWLRRHLLAIEQTL